MTFRIKTLNAISHTGLSRLPKDEFEVSSEVEHPDAIMLRSANLHGVEIPAYLTLPKGVEPMLHGHSAEDTVLVSVVMMNALGSL